MTRARAVSLALAGVAFVAVAWFLQTRLSGSREAASPDAERVAAPAAPALETVADTLGRGESFARMLADNGFDGSQVHEISELVRRYKRPRTLRPGVVMRLTGPPGATPTRLQVQLNPDTLLHVTATDSGWVARLEVVPLVVDTLRLAGVIQSSLWFADLSGDLDRLETGGFQELVYDLADVFAWKIDFTRDIRAGDAFRVAFEREVRPDGSVRSRRFLAIEFHNRGRVLPAIPYTRPGGRREYFDTEGESLRGVFLRYPVPYRITSRFTSRRYHPILKRYRPHQGVDYGAPHGTRVQATASGTVTRAGHWGGYGKIVEIRHTGGIRTRYAHLSSIAAGVRPGAVVEQGQFIGRVGATGLATGTHLHYEFLQGGRHRNPLSISLPTAPALEREHLADFQGVRDAALALLDGLAITPEPVEVAGLPDPTAR